MDCIKLKDKTKNTSKLLMRVGLYIGVGLYVLMCLGLAVGLWAIMSLIPFPGNVIALVVYSLALLGLVAYVFNEVVEFLAEKQANKEFVDRVRADRARNIDYDVFS